MFDPANRVDLILTTSGYTATAGQNFIAIQSITPVSGSTIWLPPPTPIKSQFIIADESGTANSKNVSIVAPATITISGSSTKVINTSYGNYWIYSNGTNYFILSSVP
jgi:hypothetical protein